MAQKLKSEVRERMVAAAESVFAEFGYAAATMGEIARVAEVATGNLYRYFDNKDALFYTVLTDEFVAEFLGIIERRVGSLIAAPALTELDDDARADSDLLLKFWVAHRGKVIVLLDGADESRFEDFPSQFVDALTKPALSEFRRQSGRRRLPAVVEFTTRDIFENTVRTIVAILRRHRTEAAIRQGFSAFWSYQLAGLAGLERWVIDET